MAVNFFPIKGLKADACNILSYYYRKRGTVMTKVGMHSFRLSIYGWTSGETPKPSKDRQEMRLIFSCNLWKASS